MAKDFVDNDKVVFGDVALSEGGPRSGVGVGSPGKGGWPTIRYYNKETGIEGAPYAQVTKDRMCVETGPGKPHLHDFVKKLTEREAEAEKTEL